MLENKKIFFIVGGVVAIIVLIAVIVSLIMFSPAAGRGQVTLTYWGLWEEPDAGLQTVIADYRRLHPNVTIKYARQSPLHYQERLAAAITKDGGPDIFRIHNSWLPMLKGSLAPAPADVFSAADFKAFYPVAATDLMAGGQVYAVPLEVDTLGLYVNDDIFRAGAASVPTLWDGDDGFLAVAKKLTVRDSNGRITTAGAAMGTASNVDHWQEIVGLMMVQAGVDMTRAANSPAAAAALGYYAAFAGSQRVWDETLDNSTLAFANGKVGMYFGPSWRYFDIKTINPTLNFRIVPVPQLPGGATVNYASYWAEAVSRRSPNAKVAFDFLKFMASKEELTKMYAAQAKIRGFGEPYSRVEMATLLAADPNVAPFINAVPTAKTWYLAGFTRDGDTGINSRIGKYYSDAINGVMRGGDPGGALTTVAQGIVQVLGSYGVPASMAR
jgi:multiple sugar transport system substrate-binding protein